MPSLRGPQLEEDRTERLPTDLWRVALRVARLLDMPSENHVDSAIFGPFAPLTLPNTTLVARLVIPEKREQGIE